MIQINNHDYVLVATDKKPRLLQVITTEGEYVGVVADETRASPTTQETIQFDLADVVANLGSEPYAGTAFGTKVEPFLKCLAVKGWGTVYLFRDLTNAEHQYLVKHLRMLAAKLAKDNLDVRINAFDTYIRRPHGKYAGSYRSYRSDAKQDALTLFPESIVDPAIDRLVLHEYAHALWASDVAVKDKIKWIKLYHSAVSITRLGSNTLTALYNDFVTSAMTLKEFTKSCDEDTQPVMAEVASYISAYHNLSDKDLNTLITSGESIEEYWPKNLLLSDMKTFVSEYATKSPEEMWAESFSYYMTGESLTKVVKVRVANTIKHIVGS